jgi:GTP cyclohydrolase II
MPVHRTLFASPADLDEAQAARAVFEFRDGRPVLIIDGAEGLLAAGVEGLEAELAMNMAAFADGRARLLLPAARLRRLGLDRTASGAVALPTIDLSRVEMLALKIEARIDAPVSPISDLDEAALEFARIALTCPAVVAVPVERHFLEGSGVLSVPARAIKGYRQAQVRNLKLISRAPVPLEGARNAEFAVFRGGEGLRDQVAIIVNAPDLSAPVPVRLHSACLTGDLFGSLKCDCGDQLRNTVAHMAENEGGIVLYLDQEGRGNGIANKMKAYKLQSQGWDTYDADEVLGFDLDQRRFDFAAEMLRQLGVTRVRLLTNNPEKIRAVQQAGIEVVANERVLGRLMPENVRYLASKRDRAGHFIDVEALAARTPAQD